jgi:hypothetical protein
MERLHAVTWRHPLWADTRLRLPSRNRASRGIVASLSDGQRDGRDAAVVRIVGFGSSRKSVQPAPRRHRDPKARRISDAGSKSRWISRRPFEFDREPFLRTVRGTAPRIALEDLLTHCFYLTFLAETDSASSPGRSTVSRGSGFGSASRSASNLMHCTRRFAGLRDRRR